jgi:hypothetical protein
MAREAQSVPVSASKTKPLSCSFHQSMREQRAVVRLPDGSLFADVSGPNDDS